VKSFVCWREDAVLSVTPRDAVTLTPAAFQAIHHPLRLRRRPLATRSGGEWTSEDDLLDVMRGPLRPDGFVFVPIVGDSGSGKSHLVRWAREHLEGTSGWEVRYLPKNRTNIRKVIEEVIRGLDGPAIDGAREALASAPGNTEKADVLADRLLDELALLIGHLDADEGALRSGEVALFIEKRRQHLVDVLRDPVVRRRLTEPNSVVPRLVELAMSGRRPGDGLDDDAVHVSAADLPLEFEELATASQSARDFLTKMKTIPRYLEMAVHVINEVLPMAVRRVFISSQIDLVDVFRDVRRALLADGKELALFIEDLTVLHGVEREFLDAIVEPATQAGLPVMAKLRVLFAVTEGHFDGLDTVRTRCDDAFWLDAAYDNEGVGPEEAASFVGRYLNAARIDPAQLETLWTGRQDDRWLSNSCEPCEFREHCHKTFGVTEEGYGLYPFDGVALDHFVRVLSPDRFDPRRLVAGLAHRFLQQAARELQRSEFPSGDLLAPFNDSDRGAPVLDPLELAELKAKHPSQAEQLSGVLRYWSGEEWSRVAVLDAFGLPLVQRTGTAPPKPVPDRVDRGGGVESGPQSRLKAADRRVFDALTTWASDGADLNAATTNALRKLIHSLVDSWLQAGPDPLNLGNAFDRDRFDQERHVSFEGSVSQQFRDSSIIRIAQTPENASALQALLLLDSGVVHSFEEFDRGGTYLQLVGSRIEEWVALVRASLAGPVSAESVERVRFLVVLARVLGCDQDAKQTEDLLSAVFQLRHHRDVVPVGRSAKWQTLVAEAQRLRPSLTTALEVEFGEARGRSGGIRAVRGDQLLAIIEDFAISWELQPQSAELAQLSRLLSAAVEAEWSEIQVAIDGIDRLLDAERPLQDQLSKCLEALDKAFELGRLSDDGLLRQLRQLVGEVPDDADRILRDVRALLAKNSPMDVRLRCCAGPAPVAIALVSRVFKSLDDLLSSVERDIAGRQRQPGEALDASDVMARVLASSSQLGAECRRVAP
jgi:hypothetical protein